ncbi:MAG: trimeric intracellular cation channel family protein [Propionibacterium acidifaciens]
MELLNFVGVFAFAVSGGLVGVRRRFDVFGVLVLALVTALGGGVIRDLLLGIDPPSNLSNVPFMLTAIVAGLIAFRFSGSLDRIRRLILVADAAGLGAFAVSATMLAIRHGHPGIEAILVGTITAIGGGMMRDVLAGLVPSVLTQDVYALPALLGCAGTDLCGAWGSSTPSPCGRWWSSSSACAYWPCASTGRSPSRGASPGTSPIVRNRGRHHERPLRARTAAAVLRPSPLHVESPGPRPRALDRRRARRRAHGDEGEGVGARCRRPPMALQEGTVPGRGGTGRGLGRVPRTRPRRTHRSALGMCLPGSPR